MSFLADENTRVLIQGVTGQLGSTVVELMRRGGFTPVAGVTPGKGGARVQDVPVFDSVRAASAATGADASLVLVPARGLLDAGLEAISAGLDPVVLMVDGVPIGTTTRLLRAARERGVTLVGPNSPGVISPGRCLLGALDPRNFVPGRVAVISRSGGMMSTIAHTLGRAGWGTSTCIGIGGDSLIGLEMPAAVALAEADDQTDAIVVYGEVGTRQEERLAELVASGQITKPVIGYVAGAAAPAGIRYSHAGAMSEGALGSAQPKKERLRDAGVVVVERYVDIPSALERTPVRSR